MTNSPLVLGGRYEIREVLGRGGMAEVHRALDLRLDRVVAIKMLRADLARDPEFQERFRREAQSAASLNHPAIVAVYDTGEDAVNGARVPFIVMELVEGQTLRDVLAAGRRLLPERALEITAGILAALDYSHRHGIIHRDIKPGNVMLTPRGEIKVMDFGIARAMAESTSAATQGAGVVGTAQYLSPEQARGEQVDARTDLYSTGCVLFELLTGRPPFTGESPVSVAYQHVRELPPAPSALDPSLPRAVDLVVLKSLAKDRYERYQTAAEMRGDVERARTGSGVLARPAEGTLATTALPPVRVVDHPPARPTPRSELVERRVVSPPRRRHGGAYLLLALAVLGVIAGGVVFAQRYLVNGKVLVPPVAGLSVEQATAKLVAASLKVDPTPRLRADATVPEKVVIESDPTGSVDKATTVTLVVSSGPDKVVVPELVTESYPDAVNDLRELGLIPQRVETNSAEAKDTVLQQKPVPGQQVLPNSTVTLTVSNGKVQVPDLTGKKIEDVKFILASNEGKFTYTSKGEAVADPAQDHVVLRTFPDATQTAAVGSKITIIYGRYTAPPPSEPPVSQAPATPEPEAS